MNLAKTDRLKRNYERAVALTQQLVQIPSVYRPEDPEGNEEKVANFTANYLRELGIDVYVEEVEPGRPNVIGVIDSGKPGKTLIFEGHTDVVTEGDRGSWKYDHLLSQHPYDLRRSVFYPVSRNQSHRSSKVIRML